MPKNPRTILQMFSEEIKKTKKPPSILHEFTENMSILEMERRYLDTLPNLPPLPEFPEDMRKNLDNILLYRPDLAPRIRREIHLWSKEK